MLEGSVVAVIAREIYSLQQYAAVDGGPGKPGKSGYPTTKDQYQLAQEVKKLEGRFIFVLYGHSGSYTP